MSSQRYSHASGKFTNNAQQKVSLHKSVQTLQVHVGIGYIIKAQAISHVTTLGPKYILYTFPRP